MAWAVAEQKEAGLDRDFGVQVEFMGFPEMGLAFESLSSMRSGIELLNVRHEDDRTYATVFVPQGKLDHFERVIARYLERKPRDRRTLVNTIDEIRSATLKALWTDRVEAFPTSDDETFWWEIWLPVRGDRERTVAVFKRLALAQGIRLASGQVEFPERTVLLAHTSAGVLKRCILTINSIAELRRAKETADFFHALTPHEQSEWAEDLLGRVHFEPPGSSVPHICLLDTGVNNGHPLIAGSLADADLHTVEPAWGTDDTGEHGTRMAGIALMGDLTRVLESSGPVRVSHRLESVKLLPRDGANGGGAGHHGYLTTEAVSRPEVSEPHRRRVVAMAVTARDNRDRGRPSAWSAALDRIAADAEGVGANPRLLIVSAGNIEDCNSWPHCPHSNTTDGIHDPGQAWNPLTVGACTELVRVTEADRGSLQPIAPLGGLSPFSTTSATWDDAWPLKPDVVFEGGNAAWDELSAVCMPSLSLLSTSHVPTRELLTTINATSAATALAARMAAHIMVYYPSLWPETVRALIVHSAEWTGAMKAAFLPTSARKKHYVQLVRHCGFGVPDLDRAMWSASDSLTMILEETIHPFMKNERGNFTMRDMNLHRLPWPLQELELLGETQVEMRVTLSYFIDPSPSERGHSSKYRYESHGLRFDVKRPTESESVFRSRINAAARDEEEGTRRSGDDQDWLIGKNGRHRGSIHSDIWRGSAADLASRGAIAVYPALGWWKTRPKLERFDQVARYALVVSIRAPEVYVDLYAAVANQLGIEVTTQLP